ncbi:hypothetical protein E8E12_002658 [Didymella heteroderae]|uniref:GTPase n=1 Tax=Didymella heteroderae TaxID=1769908 RepID=A0A9P4WU60_9PLEO|nr:hypothetical protein E8E12_002658 [Didymella heteroderae]
MSTSSAMSPYWVEWHKENTFKNCETSSLELAPVAFPSLPIDQPRPVKDVRSRVDTVDFIRQQERKESRLVRDTPLKARDPSRSVRCHPEASHARGTKKAHESNESGLIFEPSPLRDPGEINIVSKEKWQTLELWYALPPFDLRKARSAIQVERKRLTAEGTLQVRAFLPKKDSTCEFTTLEKLVAQRKLLETKLQMLKYKGAKLLNPDKPSKLPRALSGIRLSFEEQRIRSINQRLALEVNQLLEHAKYKHHFSSIPSKRVTMATSDQESWLSVDQDAVRSLMPTIVNNLRRKIEAAIGKRRTHHPEIDGLMQALREAEIAPPVQFFKVALSGDQGIGKSSLLIALLDGRRIIEVSLGRKACTQFAAIIKLLPGASTNTKKSNITVNFRAENEIIDMITEHLRRYADVYSRSTLHRSMREEANGIVADDVTEAELSGDGDLNQIRKAVINEFRCHADFELVVADPCHYPTSEGADDYLRRAVQQHGSINTVLVLNKIDRVLHIPIDEMVNLIDAIDEEPFLTLSLKVSAATRKKQNSIMQGVRIAYSKYQVDDIKAHLPRACRDVTVYAASANLYLEQLREDSFDDSDDERRQRTELETGIIALQNLLLSLAAKPNYTSLYSHVFNQIGDIQSRCERILEKYEDDKSFAVVRKDLQNRVPGLISNITDLYQCSIQKHVSIPWSDCDMSVLIGLRTVEKSWSGRTVAHQTFTHMVRERGIPTSRSVAAGRNLHKGISETYKEHVKNWGQLAMQTGDLVCTLIDAPIQELFKDLQRKFDQTPVDPDLKRTANDALQKTIVRVALQHGNLIRDLAMSTMAIAKDYSIEETLYSPVARRMVPAYVNVSSMQGRKGIIAKRHAELFRRVHGVVNSIPMRIVEQESRKWTQLCKQFVEMVEGHLTRVTEIMEELLENEPSPSSKHARVRDVLDDHLSEFSASFRDLQQMFPNSDVAEDGDDVPVKFEEDDDACGLAFLDDGVSNESEDNNDSVESESDDEFGRPVQGLKTKPTVKTTHEDRLHSPVEGEGEDKGMRWSRTKHRPAKRARGRTTCW